MRFAGYAAVFNRPDRGGDIIRPGAFKQDGVGRRIPIYWQHDPERRIGVAERVEEDAHGLRVIGSVKTDRVRPGTGLSFGYRTRKVGKGTYRELLDLELIEISLVNHPMQPLARVLAVHNEGETHGL